MFMMISVDGYFEGENHDISWHNVDVEFNELAIENFKRTDTLLFGRRTYQLMESYWPTPEALRDDLVIAKSMNNIPKIIVSRTLSTVTETENWKNVRLIKQDVISELKKLKSQKGQDIAIFGSNNLCVSLMKEGLVDEFRIMVNPVVLGKGTLLFKGFDRKLDLKLVKTRIFKNGNVLLYYSLKTLI